MVFFMAVPPLSRKIQVMQILNPTKNLFKLLFIHSKHTVIKGKYDTHAAV